MKPHNRSHRGFSIIEVLVVLLIIGIIAAAVMPLAGKAIRRARALSAYSDMNRVLTQARLNSIQRGFQVVARFTHDTVNDKILVTVWEDRNPDFLLGTYVPPGGGAAVPEVVLGTFTSQATFHAWKQGGTIDNYTEAIAFNTYGGDASLAGLVAFLPTGALVPPEDSASAPPTASAGRGIYLADANGKNFFRLTFPSNLVAKVRIEKYVESVGYTPINWTWN